MSSRISQRMRSRRNQCSSANGLLDHPAVGAQARAVVCSAAGDHRGDARLADLPAVLVMVMAAVSVDRIRVLPGPAAAVADWRDRLDQRHQLGDVVAVAAGQRHRQRDPVRLGDHVVLRARTSLEPSPGVGSMVSGPRPRGVTPLGELVTVDSGCPSPQRRRLYH
jgi:hypothetical protein